ncbi:hypothetical protein M405DRAFT_812749, partial [Rhizopogon salebrosus TDB-379]
MSGGEVVRGAAVEIAEIAGVEDEREAVASNCGNVRGRDTAPDGCVMLLWRGYKSPAEVFFAFFAFSLFTRTSLADEFLCMIYIELKVQECKHTRLARRPRA